MMQNKSIIALLWIVGFPLAASFSTPPIRHNGAHTSLQAQPSAVEEAQRLLEKSKALREEIALQEKESPAATTTQETPAPAPVSKWNLPQTEEEGVVDYRIYVDIGREEGTWMEPRWGASGKRIEFTLDVRFHTTQPADKEATEQMVNDNQSGNSSPVYSLETASCARLRSGFDQMKCQPGAFRMDQSSKPGQSDTMRFYVNVNGTPERGSSYGDLFVPQGPVYFSIPCFGSVAQLSQKGEMPVTVRQMGWHTGWRREESRILGIFKAVPMEKAKQKDGF